ncbi:MAG: DUF2461 domain-containing protein [Oscillospiraceae bacterium]|nr:DUF2461 domain-containing protein [Oscillospiraceae bacterium]
MAFSQATLDFLTENRINDSRLWFNEHKAEYMEHVRDPMRGFVEEISSFLAKIDPMIICDPVRSVSRIWRDARYSKTLFRENLWCDFSRDRHIHMLPSFFFEITPFGFTYGCGCYETGSDFMGEYRRLVLADSPLFTEALEAVRGSGLKLMDTRYKRTRHPDSPEWQREWLDQRSVCVLAESGDLGALFSDELPKKIGGEFKKLKQFYAFLLLIAQTVM